MPAMYQPSTTPPPEYSWTESPIFQNQSLDFCNSFWGFGTAGVKAGVDVLFARMRGAAQTIEDLNTFWKERASIEEDYAKRLAKLAQMTLGRDETGDLRKSLDTMAAETESQARYHLILAQQFRTGLEGPTTVFHARLLRLKTAHQAGIEKLFDTEQTWEPWVNKAREKYEQEYARVKSSMPHPHPFLYESRELSNISTALKETVIKWEQSWKSFCASCQDMEENCMDFVKNNLLNYANAVSLTYVASAACCESMRCAFEQMEVEKDAAFDFVNYSPPNTIPSASSQPTSRIATSTRYTSQELPLIQNSMPLALKEGPLVNAADIDNGKGATNDPDVGGSVVGTSSQSITLSSKAQPIPYPNDIQLTASMANQKDGLDPLTTPLEQLENTISTSQNAIRPLPIPPTVLVSMVPNSIQPVGVEVTQALADRQPVFEEHMWSSQRNRTAGRHALSMNQISTADGEGGGARLPVETPQHHDHSNLVWRSPSKPPLQAADGVLDSDSDEADESGSYYSATDEPEMCMPVMQPQPLVLFLRQHEHDSLNSNVNPINFVIRKMMKARRAGHRPAYSTSGSSMKADTDSFISGFTESPKNFSPVSLSSWQ